METNLVLVYASDGRPIDRKSIIKEFLNTKHENLKHKPKFFFFIVSSIFATIEGSITYPFFDLGINKITLDFQ